MPGVCAKTSRRLLSTIVGTLSSFVIEVFLVTVIRGPSTSFMMCWSFGRVSSRLRSRTSTFGSVVVFCSVCAIWFWAA